MSPILEGIISAELKSALTDEQLVTIANHIKESDDPDYTAATLGTTLALMAIKDHLDDIVEYIIDTIVFPYNLKKLKTKIVSLMEDGKHSVMGVIGDELNPPLAYSIGATPIVGFEVFCSGLDPSVAGSIINNLVELSKKGKTLEEIEHKLIKKTGGGKSKVRLLRYTLTSALANEYVPHVTRYLEQSELKDLVNIVFPDANGLFPGDDEYDETFEQMVVRPDDVV